METFKRVFKEDDYKDFINIISNQEEVLKVDTSPIDNYDSSLIIDKEKLKTYYQKIKYYLDRKALYGPKLREGIAIASSKIAVLSDCDVANIERYFITGDSISGNFCNPFEEIARLLMNLVKKEYELDCFEPTNNLYHSFQKNEYEKNARMDVVKELLNSDKMVVKNSFYYQNWSGIIGKISNNLETSNITNSKVVDKDLLLEQFTIIANSYQNKLDVNKVVTGLPKEGSYDKLINRFSDKITYAKRNIGMYSKTRQLKK